MSSGAAWPGGQCPHWPALGASGGGVGWPRRGDGTRRGWVCRRVQGRSWGGQGALRAPAQEKPEAQPRLPGPRGAEWTSGSMGGGPCRGGASLSQPPSGTVAQPGDGARSRGTRGGLWVAVSRGPWGTPRHSQRAARGRRKPDAGGSRGSPRQQGSARQGQAEASGSLSPSLATGLQDSGPLTRGAPSVFRSVVLGLRPPLLLSGRRGFPEILSKGEDDPSDLLFQHAPK